MTMNKKPTPPRWAIRLLEWYCDPQLLEEVLGDLQEEFEYQLERVGEKKAQWEYVQNVFGFIRPFMARRNSKDYFPLSVSNPLMVRHHIVMAFRQFHRQKAFTLIHVAGLTLGIGACLLIYLIAAFEFSFDTFHPQKERIYRVVGEMQFSTGETVHNHIVPSPAPRAMRQEIAGLETVAGFQLLEHAQVRIPQGSHPQQRLESRQLRGGTATILTTPAYFDIFPYQWLAGNPTTALAEPFQVVLTQQSAQRYFGETPVEKLLGKKLIYNDSLRVMVAGIIKDWSGNTDFDFTDFISLSTAEHSFLKQQLYLSSWDYTTSASNAFVRVAPGTTPQQVNEQLTRLLAKYRKPDPRLMLHLRLLPLAEIHFNPNYSEYPFHKAHLPTLYSLFAVAGFILLLAMINFVNLSTAQSLRRAKEIGVRKVLGSSRTSLAGQFLTQTGLLTGLAVILSLLLVKPALWLFKDYTPPGFRIDLLQPQTLLFLIGMTVLTTLLAGFYPARILAAYLPVRSLKGDGYTPGNSKWYLRKSLIVVQFTIALCFAIAAIVISSQVHFMQTRELGFQGNRVINLQTHPAEQSGKVAVLAQKLRQLPGIEQVITESAPPMGFMNIEQVMSYQGQEYAVSMKPANETYLTFYGLKLLAGRNLQSGDGQGEYLINETLARKLGFARPDQAVGQHLRSRGQNGSIVGVVADFHQFSLREPISPVVITNLTHFQHNLGIKLQPAPAGDPAHETLLSAIEKHWKGVFPDAPLMYRFLEETIDAAYEQERKMASLVNVGMGISFFISCLGIVGLSVFTTEQKRKELSVRKVLGATVSSLVILLSKEIVLLVGLAVVVASPLAGYGLNQWLAGFAYRISTQWWMFGLAGLVTMLVALLSISLQTLQAARANPVDSLRND